MEPDGLSPWYLRKNTLLRPWAPKRSRLREARYCGRRKVGAQAPRLRRGYPPVAKSAEATSFDTSRVEAQVTHSSSDAIGYGRRRPRAEPVAFCVGG
jgi:hypothetical protein